MSQSRFSNSNLGPNRFPADESWIMVEPGALNGINSLTNCTVAVTKLREGRKIKQ
jgi:hypothetical protein